MIHTSYTVGITTGEFKALETVMSDQKDWIDNAIKNRASIAINDITTKYTQYKINKGEAITAPWGAGHRFFWGGYFVG